MKGALFLAGWLFFACAARADDAEDLLRTISDKYDSLTTYEFEGMESASIPGTDCTLEFPIKVAAALPEFPPVRHMGSPKLSKICLEERRKLDSVSAPGEWSNFGSIAAGVIAVKELPQQILRLPGQQVLCRVLEVVYDDYYRKLRSYGGPVRYWVDAQTDLIRRVEFKETSPQGFWFWTATLERVNVGGPTASWLTGTDWRPPSLVGKPAPDFALRTADGTLVHLAELKGEVVVLDFWATWCGPCEEEIPMIEKLQAEKTMPGVAVFGVTDESQSEVSKWLSEHKRSFQTLVDAKKVFDDFGIKPIPVLVMINREGAIAEYDFGFHSERGVRELIGKHLSH